MFQLRCINLFNMAPKYIYVIYILGHSGNNSTPLHKGDFCCQGGVQRKQETYVQSVARLRGHTLYETTVACN